MPAPPPDSPAPDVTVTGPAAVERTMTARGGAPVEGYPDWAFAFEAFGLHHLIVVLVVGGLVAAWIRFGLRARATEAGRERESRVRWAVGGGVLATQLLMIAYWMEPARYSRLESWPLHLCDVLGLLVPFVLWRPGVRWLQTIVFFWGFGLTTQAFITPTLKAGPADATYWFYWAQHGAIVAAACYGWAVLGYRPRARDYGLITLINLGALAVMLPLNALLGVNYFYVGDVRPDRPTMIDRLGPWPQRVPMIFAIAQAVLAGFWGASAAGGGLLRRAQREGLRGSRKARGESGEASRVSL